jgi:UDP-N-acetylmuramate dehydrogenase
MVAMPELRNRLLAPHTVMGLGGPAAKLVEATSRTEIINGARNAADHGEPLLVLGGGSNVVIADEGFAGTALLVRSSGIEAVRSGSVIQVTVAAGELLSTFVTWAGRNDLTGVECLAGIPGTVGATPVQNVGAYGQEVADVISSLTVYDTADGTVNTWTNADCAFGHRVSAFKNTSRWIILDVTFRLPEGECSAPILHAEPARALGVPVGGSAPLAAVSDAVVAIRRRKSMVVDATDPDSRSVGSFFANPVIPAADFEAVAGRVGDRPPHWPVGEHALKVSAAWLIERAGFHRGDTHGGIRISRKHALALTNPGHGTAHEVAGLARRIRDAVHRLSGIHLTPEPELVGVTI